MNAIAHRVGPLVVKCYSCSLVLLDNLNCISCTLYDHSLHRSHFRHINQASTWFYEECISYLFPFNHFSDDNEFNDCLRDLDPMISKIDLLTDGPCLNLFGDVSNIRPLLNNPDLDPDENYFEISLLSCKYDSPTNVVPIKLVGNACLSLMHINCRSILPKLPELLTY